MNEVQHKASFDIIYNYKRIQNFVGILHKSLIPLTI